MTTETNAPLMSTYGGADLDRGYPITPPVRTAPLLSRSGWGSYPSEPGPPMQPVMRPMDLQPQPMMRPMEPQQPMPAPPEQQRPVAPMPQPPMVPEQVGVGDCYRQRSSVLVSTPFPQQQQQPAHQPQFSVVGEVGVRPQEQQQQMPRKFFKIEKVKMMFEFPIAGLTTSPLSERGQVPALESGLVPAAVERLLACSHIVPGNAKPQILIGYVALVSTENNSDFAFIASAPWTRRREALVTSVGQFGTFEIPTGNHMHSKDAGSIYTLSQEDLKYVEETLNSAFVGTTIEAMTSETRSGQQMVINVSPNIYVVVDSMMGIAIAHMFGAKYDEHRGQIPGTNLMGYMIDPAEFEAIQRIISDHLQMTARLVTDVKDIKTSIMFEMMDPPTGGRTRNIEEIAKAAVSGLVSPEGEGLEYIMKRRNRIGATFEIGYYVFA